MGHLATLFRALCRPGSGPVFVLIWGLVPACSVVFFPLSSRLFLPLAGLFSLLRRGPVFAPGIKFPGASDGGYVRGPENLYLRGRFRVLLISGVFPYLCRYENRELEHLYTKLQGSVW